MSLAIIYSVLRKSAEHACSCADLKLNVLLKDSPAMSAYGKEKKSVTFASKYLKYPHVFVGFLMHLACVTLTCFLRCPMWTSPIMSYILPKLLLSINKTAIIMSYYTRIFNCADDTGEHEALCCGNYSSLKCRHKWNDADVENIWP